MNGSKCPGHDVSCVGLQLWLFSVAHNRDSLPLADDDGNWNDEHVAWMFIQVSETEAEITIAILSSVMVMCPLIFQSIVSSMHSMHDSGMSANIFTPLNVDKSLNPLCFSNRPRHMCPLIAPLVHTHACDCTESHSQSHTKIETKDQTKQGEGAPNREIGTGLTISILMLLTHHLLLQHHKSSVSL